MAAQDSMVVENKPAKAAADVQDLFGSPDHMLVNRALAEFRAGRPIVIAGESETLITLPVEHVDDRRWASFVRFCAPASPFLVVTQQRSRVLGLTGNSPVALRLAPGLGAEQILSLATDAKIDVHLDSEPLDGGPFATAATAAIALAKMAQSLPAVLAASIPLGWAASLRAPIVSVPVEAIEEFRRGLLASLNLTAQSDIPLHGGISAHFAVFTDMLGYSQVAVIVGQPNFTEAVPVRLHSACLTGDVFGSRRCDCGDQLRLALVRLQKAGGGIILYLAQEGRGLGLVNKMRAYRLQDAGLDTLDANTTLGFEHDERDYLIAARMLKILGCNRVLLMSNNPAKISGLSDAGIEIAGSIPLVTPVTPHNRRYLAAKAVRAGHRLGELTKELTEDGARKSR
jgi:GTP cyclohydrolase II